MSFQVCDLAGFGDVCWIVDFWVWGGPPFFGFLDSLDFWILGFLGFRIFGFLDFWISGFLDSRISGFSDFWILGFLDFWPNISFWILGS